jgi:hypothetical protein
MDKVKVELNMPKILNKVENDQFGKFLANEWYRLISPYTPRRTGNLEQTVTIEPFKIKYLQPYAYYVYTGEEMNFSKEKNSLCNLRMGQSRRKCRTKRKADKSG